MTFRSDLEAARDEILSSDFAVRKGREVPETTEVGFTEAVKIDAVFLYADMIGSSTLAAISPKDTVGKVFRSYLDLSVRVMKKNGGAIRSFDGDRVMAIYMGDSAADDAVKSAMNIKWVCSTLLQPKLESKYKSIREAGWKLYAGCGIATGETFIVRGGVRRTSSDLVSIGVAPNLAAKLSDIRDGSYHIRIGKGAYGALTTKGRESSGKNMWQGPYNHSMGGKSYDYYRTSYHWSL